MSTLSEQLAALGIRAQGDAPTIDLVDELNSLLSALGDARAIDPALATDVHHVLCLWVERLEYRLAREHGAKLLRPRCRMTNERCEHVLIETDETNETVSCRSCGATVNAAWWLARHSDKVSRTEDWRRSLERDVRHRKTEIEGLKKERAKLERSVRGRKMTQAKQALREDGSDYLIPPATKRKPKRR